MTRLEETTPRCQLAGILCNATDKVDELIAGVARALSRDGWQVGGYLQISNDALSGSIVSGGAASDRVTSDRVARASEPPTGTSLYSLRSGNVLPLFQEDRVNSCDCRLDVERLLEISTVMLEELRQGVDLFVLNRFGRQEATGRGLCRVIELALELEIPLLTVVREEQAQHWVDFGGEYVTSLPCDQHAVSHWCMSVLKEQTLTGSMTR